MAPRLRGADAIQAAAAAQQTQAPAAAPADAPNVDTKVSSMDGVVTFPLKGFTPMLDLKGTCAIRAGSREPMIRSFRLLLPPEEKCVPHVISNCPGHYILVDGASWHYIDFPCWVVFSPNTKRSDELAVNCSDCLRTNSTMDMLTIESAMQPLRVHHNLYRHELRITRMADLASFRPIASTIDEAGIISPWSDEKFPFYNELGLGNY
eukprot:6177989-Pleurochrysis_carterae.AAC.4